jgi:hypothetical protein
VDCVELPGTDPGVVVVVVVVCWGSGELLDCIGPGSVPVDEADVGRMFVPGSGSSMEAGAVLV